MRIVPVYFQMYILQFVKYNIPVFSFEYMIFS